MDTSRETISYSTRTNVLLALILSAVVGYVYFLNMSVVHVVVQKEAMAEIQEVKNEIAQLEAQYILAQHKIAARMASAEGVSAERTKIFVSRDTADDLAVNQ